MATTETSIGTLHYNVMPAPRMQSPEAVEERIERGIERAAKS